MKIMCADTVCLFANKQIKICLFAMRIHLRLKQIDFAE